MKRLLSVIVLILLLLCGCAAEQPDDTVSSTAGAETVESSSETTEPTSPYPDGTAQLHSAVLGIPLEAECSGVAFMGEKLLLFFGNGSGSTTLKLYSGQNYREELSAELGGNVSPESGSVQIQEKRIGYYNAAEGSIDILDSKLKLSERIPMPEDSVGTPVLSSDLSAVFYCTESDVRVMDLDTGISRLLRQRACLSQNVKKVMFDDTVLQCFVLEQDDDGYTEFISTETGETIGIDSEFVRIDAWKDSYFFQRIEGSVVESVFGETQGQAQCIVPEDEDASIYSVLPMNSVLTVSCSVDAGVRLELYDLSTGRKSSGVELENLKSANSLTADPNGEYLWFLSYDHGQNKNVLCCWDVSVSALHDQTVYTDPRYTADAPDTEGLAVLRERADTLEDLYGVKIYLEDTFSEPDDYSFIYEFHVRAFQNGLDDLERALAKFPDGFFKTLGEISDSGRIRIGLVRQLQSLTENAPAGTAGLQYWMKGSPYIVLPIGEALEQSFYHEVSHVLDSYIFAESLAYDSWDDLNPANFQYDGNYTDYVLRADQTYLEGESRYFIDAYSMTYAKEDRARILEYALTDGNAAFFESDAMQAKLRQICVGIRDAFGWKKNEQSLPWEQYLNESLAYVKK